jgi:hypothetical protein
LLFRTNGPANSEWVWEVKRRRWIHVDTSKEVGDRDHLKVFANEDAAETWLQENDPEGVVFEYEVLE